MAQPASRWLREQNGGALVEVALVLPMLIFLALGVVGVGRVLQAQMGVSAVAREAARSAALAQSPGSATERGQGTARSVAVGYSLTNGSLVIAIDPGDFERGGTVWAAARYEVSLADLPLLGWAHVQVASDHVERIDLYRSRWPTGGK